MDDETRRGALVKPIPRSIEAIEAADKVHKHKPLKDHVKPYVKLLLAEDDHFHALMEAGYPEDAVEGSLDGDDWAGTMYLRNYAKAEENHFLAKQPLAKLKAAMKRALNDLDFGRWQRRPPGSDANAPE